MAKKNQSLSPKSSLTEMTSMQAAKRQTSYTQLISIITPCYNRKTLIIEAVESVLNQDYPNFEHIIVDGSSTDGTLEVLQKYPHLKIISEPDNGIYDAVNKGIRIAKGDIIGWLNSDDLYMPNIFHKISNQFVENSEIDVVIGNAVKFQEDADGNQKIVETNRHFEDGKIDFNADQDTGVLPNICFFHRRVYEQYGVYNPELKIAGDLEFLLRMATFGIKGAHLNEVIYQYRIHAGSLTFKPRERSTNNDLKQTSHFMVRHREDLSISKSYLQKKGISNNIIGYCKKRYTNSTVRVGYKSLQNGKVYNFLKYTYFGWRMNWRWPFFFTTFAIKKLKQ